MNKQKSVREKIKGVNWWKILQVSCLFIFIAQIFALMQLVIFNHYSDIYNISGLITNYIIFAFALSCVCNLIPENFHIKKQGKN